jgi:hypothetical protein
LQLYLIIGYTLKDWDDWHARLPFLLIHKGSIILRECGISLHVEKSLKSLRSMCICVWHIDSIAGKEVLVKYYTCYPLSIPYFKKVTKTVWQFSQSLSPTSDIPAIQWTLFKNNMIIINIFFLSDTGWS